MTKVFLKRQTLAPHCISSPSIPFGSYQRLLSATDGKIILMGPLKFLNKRQKNSIYLLPARGQIIHAGFTGLQIIVEWTDAFSRK